MFKSIWDQIWFFDCEWVPDPKAGRLLYRLPREMPDNEVLAEMWKRNGATDDDPQPFLKTNLCRLVSIAAVMRRTVTPQPGQQLDPENKVKLNLLWLPRDVNSPENTAEASIVGSFLQAVGKYKPQLVGFNSRASDLKILFQRAFVNGIVAKDFCKRPEKPWEGIDYFAKDNDCHVDLMDVLGGFSSRNTPSLNEVAVLSGIPGKIGTCGDDVAGMWLEGKWREIVQYNCFDAITTYLVWLRMAHLGGFISDEDYEIEQEILNDTLLSEAEKDGMSFLNNYIDEWERLRQAYSEL